MSLQVCSICHTFPSLSSFSLISLGPLIFPFLTPLQLFITVYCTVAVQYTCQAICSCCTELYIPAKRFSWNWPLMDQNFKFIWSLDSALLVTKIFFHGKLIVVRSQCLFNILFTMYCINTSRARILWDTVWSLSILVL